MLKKLWIFAWLLSFFLLGQSYATDKQQPCAFAEFYPYHLMTLNMSGFDYKTQHFAPLDLVSISQQTGIKNFTLAFVIDSGSCRPAWDGEFTTASGWAKDLTDRMRAAGIKYSISFGGASGNDISRACSDAQLLAAYQQIINTYRPNMMDFDIENGTANVGRVINALKTLQANNPTVKLSFTLPVMPTGLESEGKSILTQAKNAGLNYIVNIMAMDYSSSHTGDMGQYAVQAATSTFNYLKTLYPQKTSAELWKMVAVTPMIGVNDITVERFTLANTDTLRSFAIQNQLAFLSMWSLDRDKPCGGSTPQENCSSGNVQTKNWEFSQHFMQCGSNPPPPPPPPPPGTCLPPANIKSTVSADKRTITLSWEKPANSAPILTYQVNDWLNRLMWKGPELTFSDRTLPGTNGSFDYFLYSNCQNGMSKGVKYVVTIR